MRSERSLTVVALATSLGLITAIALSTSLDGSRSQPPRTEVAAFDGSLGPAPRTEVAAAQAPETDLSTNAQTAPADGGPGEAVRVHGHWILEIREPDGSLVRTVEFDNALVAQSTILTGALSRSRSVGTWLIFLTGSGRGTDPCRAANQNVCILIEAEDAAHLTGSDIFPTLTVSVPVTGPNAGKLVLAGNATALVDGDVGLVETQLVLCGSNTPPRTCNRGSLVALDSFTRATLQPSQSVQAGQQIRVTVVISFR